MSETESQRKRLLLISNSTRQAEEEIRDAIGSSKGEPFVYFTNLKTHGLNRQSSRIDEPCKVFQGRGAWMKETTDNLRAAIDSIDDELLRLLNNRAELALKVGAAKRRGDTSLCDNCHFRRQRSCRHRRDGRY
jgi:Chorismate mutase type II